MLWLSESVHEDEVGIAVDHSCAGHVGILLVLPLFQEGRLNMTEHGDLTNAVDGLRRVNIAVTAVLSMTVVYKCVIHVDHIIVEIDVAPAESNGFTNTHSCTKQNRKHRIPVPVLRCTLEVVKEQRLFL